MHTRIRLGAAVLAAISFVAVGAAQTHGERERFTAVAVQNSVLGSGAGTVLISVDRWSTDAERETLVTTLQERGPRALLDQLQDMKPVGRVRTPDIRSSLRSTGAGGRRRETDRHCDRPSHRLLGSLYQSRTLDYPFAVIQMNIGPDGHGKGTMSTATKITTSDHNIELENFDSSPVMLTEVTASRDSD